MRNVRHLRLVPNLTSPVDLTSPGTVITPISDAGEQATLRRIWAHIVDEIEEAQRHELTGQSTDQSAHQSMDQFARGIQ